MKKLTILKSFNEYNQENENKNNKLYTLKELFKILNNFVKNENEKIELKNTENDDILSFIYNDDRVHLFGPSTEDVIIYNNLNKILNKFNKKYENIFSAKMIEKGKNRGYIKIMLLK